MIKIFQICIGILLISYALNFFIIYLNLITLGFNFFDYLLYLITHFETLLFIPGIMLILFALKDLK